MGIAKFSDPQGRIFHISQLQTLTRKTRSWLQIQLASYSLRVHKINLAKRIQLIKQNAIRVAFDVVHRMRTVHKHHCRQLDFIDDGRN